MTVQQATAEVFWTAFKALSKGAREDVLARIASDPSLREDLLDLALIEKRRHEKARPFAEYVAERSPKR
ncbi:MAG: hypothetical protein AAB339_06805 [Elusimicrobiota bacterium]